MPLSANLSSLHPNQERLYMHPQYAKRKGERIILSWSFLNKRNRSFQCQRNFSQIFSGLLQQFSLCFSKNIFEVREWRKAHELLGKYIKQTVTYNGNCSQEHLDFSKQTVLGVNHSIMWVVFSSINLWKSPSFTHLQSKQKNKLREPSTETMLGNGALQTNAASNLYSHWIVWTDPKLTMAALSWKTLWNKWSSLIHFH